MMYKTHRLKNELNPIYDASIKEFLNPEYLYFPGEIVDNLKVGSSIYKDSIVTTKPLAFSSVSGIIKSLSNNTVTIQNDFMENYESPKKPSKTATYTLEIIIKLLKAYNFTNNAIIKELTNHPKTILINGLDNLPFESTRKFLLSTNVDHILETCEILNNTVKPVEFIITFKNTDNQNIEIYNDNVGSFPFITYYYLNDEYPLIYKEILTKKLSLNYYNTVMINVEELLEIYEIVMRLKPVAETYLSIITDDANSFVLKTKIGTKLIDIIKFLNLSLTNKSCYLNNLLNQKSINPQEYIISLETQAIYIINLSPITPSKCINCGNCNNVCPFNLNPLNPQDLEKCRHCGLCSYYCPAHINLDHKEGEKNA